MPRLLLTSTLVFAAFCLAAQSAYFHLLREGEPLRVADRMAEDQTQGLSMVILLDGEPILNRQWGYRNPAEQPVTAGTVFQVGSMSQPITQLAILQ